MRNFRYLCLVFFFIISPVNSENSIEIKFKVENEIVTNYDLIKERNYLISLNKQLSEIPNRDLDFLAKRSLLNEKVKKNTLNNYFNLTKKHEIAEKLFVNLYKNLGFKSENEFNNYLINLQLDSDYFKEKVKIDSLWNQLIFNKFRNQVVIDKKKIKEEVLSLKLKDQNNKEYLISEILFKLEDNENVNEKYKLIKENINSKGFETAANIFSFSKSSKLGGNIGWVKKSQLNDSISKTLDEIPIGNLSDPIKFPSGYLIVKVNKIRNSLKQSNIDQEIEKRIDSEIDRQLNQFSLIFFNKVKQNNLISEF
tara:strand:- start:51 stop:980 length:930 start_codon:yes stop_codon:yes gene_type:complete